MLTTEYSTVEDSRIQESAGEQKKEGEEDEEDEDEEDKVEHSRDVSYDNTGPEEDEEHGQVSSSRNEGDSDLQ